MNKRSKDKRGPILLMGILLVTAVIAFVSWYSSSFKRPLSDDQIIERLETGDARSIQHALSQLEERLSPRYDGRARFREPVVALAKDEYVEIRRQVAWVMGREPAPVYRETLTKMLADADLGARVMAACSLSNWNDPLARPVLLTGLDAFELRAEAAGTLDLKLEVGDAASLGTGLGSIKRKDGEAAPVRTPLNGFIQLLPKGKDGDVVVGDVIAKIAPGPKTVLNLLTALGYVGKYEDLPILERFAGGGVERMTKEVEDAARAAIDAVKTRGR